MSDLTNLQNLHDIIQPPPPPLLPPAPGWYVVGFVVITTVIWLSVIWFKQWKRNSYRREAMAELNDIESSFKKTPGKKDILLTIPELVKRTAISAYGRSMTASLSGSSWLEFLDNTINSTEFTSGPGRLLTTIAYESPDKLNTVSDSDITNLLTTVRSWITRHELNKNQGAIVTKETKT